jgi:hypothetical protein
MRISFLIGLAALGMLTACDPYSPGQRAVGGGAIGAGTGAAVSGLAGGRPATGALIGGGIGAAGGALTTPSRQYSEPATGYSYRSNGYYDSRY